MPNVEIKDGQVIEKDIKNPSSKKQENGGEKETSVVENKLLNILTSKFNLILIGIIILLVYLLYRSYTSE